MVSVIVPFHGEFKEIEGVLHNLYTGIRPDDLEIIVVNDGSKQTNTRFRPIEPTKDFNLRTQKYVRVINNPVSFGVGYSFDRGAEIAKGDILVLTASDVYPEMGWYDKVRNEVLRNPNTLGGACCVGSEGGRKYYGADLLFTVGIDDLPPKSPLRTLPNYSELFKGRWLPAKVQDTPYEIPCLMGAFYFTSKAYYKAIGGFDTIEGNRNRGHQSWGSLEPYISLKSWLVGGGCTMYPSIEAKHIFHRFRRETKWDGGVRGEDRRLWNQLFILETQIMDEVFRQKLSNFLKPRLNLGVARKRIKDHYAQVLEVREANQLWFKNTYKIFEEKFNYVF